MSYLGHSSLVWDPYHLFRGYSQVTLSSAKILGSFSAELLVNNFLELKKHFCSFANNFGINPRYFHSFVALFSKKCVIYMIKGECTDLYCPVGWGCRIH